MGEKASRPPVGKVMALILLLAMGRLGARELRIGGTGVSFEVPDEFTALSQSLIDRKWPLRNAPRFAVGTPTGSTTIAYDLKDQDISRLDPDELRKKLETVFERMVPGIRWIDRRVINRAGRKWIFFEMSSHALDTDIHNLILISPLGRQMLVFNFNSTRAEIGRYRPLFIRSILSIRIDKGTVASSPAIR